MNIKISTTDKLKYNKIIKILSKNNSFEDIVDSIVNVECVHISVVTDKLLKIKIVQSDVEAKDIIDHFKEKFNKDYDLDKCGKFCFQSYNRNNEFDHGKSNVIFTYKLRMFEII